MLPMFIKFLKFKPRRPAHQVVHAGQPGHACPTCGRIPPSEAELIFEKFGGIQALHDALKEIGAPRHIATLHKWKYPAPRGCNGRVPDRKAWADLRAAAKLKGVTL